MIRVEQIYDSIMTVLLEPSGPKLGLITEKNVLSTIGIVVQDFIQRTGLVRAFYCQQALLAQSQYETPPEIQQIEGMFYDQTHLDSNTSFDVQADNYTSDLTLPSFPETYYEDEQDPKRFSVYPKPQLTGPQANTDLGNPGYGTIAAIAPGTFQFSVIGSGFGVVGSYESSCYFDPVLDGYGTLGYFCASEKNFVMVGAVQPIESLEVMQDILNQIPDSFLIYMKYGALARIFSNDGELKDTRRATYCARRYDEGVSIAQAILRQFIDMKVSAR